MHAVLKVPDDLRNHPDELARNVRDILRCQLPLVLAPASRGTERRLHFLKLQQKGHQAAKQSNKLLNVQV